MTNPIEHLLKSLFVMATMVEARDPYTGGHLWRVSQFCRILAEQGNLPQSQVARTSLGGFLHDLGKIGVPDAILNKPGKLNSEEYDIVKTHPDVGHRLLADHPLAELVRSAVLSHHERPDGSGYPQQLSDGQISREARIVAVCDAFNSHIPPMMDIGTPEQMCPQDSLRRVSFSHSGRKKYSNFKICYSSAMKNIPPDRENSLFSSYSEHELTALRHDMLRFAVLQLHDNAAAEDAVQESIAAALAGAQRFRNHSHLKTWVFAILKHKIIDIIRERTRHPTSPLSTDESGNNDPYDELFDEKGYWKEDNRPSDWGDPEKSFSNKQFWQIFQLCLDHLPENTVRVFMMREVLGFETKEICNELTISSANCWVLLHRARMSLRLCLEHRWFHAEDTRADL